jgi:3',5'-cyclic AMP phosphodiesterase CpdA
MQRREFLKVAGGVGVSLAAGTQAGLGTRGSGTTWAAEAKPALSIERAAEDRFVMQFAPEAARPLRVLQLTDTHFGSPDPGSQAEDRRSFDEIAQMVKLHQPDFVVHTGDFINNDQGPKVSFEAIDVFDSLGVPWTHAVGNHDIGYRQVDEFRKLMKQAHVGEFHHEKEQGYAFRFDVLAPGQSQPGYSIFCFDSGFRDPNRRVSREQLDWFTRQAAQDAEAGVKAPAVAMIHIPVIEFDKVRDAKKHKGIYGERVCFDNDTGDTFAALHAPGRMKAVFSGHDHMNDYCGVWEGIELVYGRVSGWSAYGILKRGGRLIEIDPVAGTYSHKVVFPA